MIIAVDFDGTLCSDQFPKIGKPKKDIIKVITQLRQRGVKIILWTSRVGTLIDDAVAWCKEQGLEFDAVNENLPEVQSEWGGDTRKVFADYYVDDKNFGGLDLQLSWLELMLTRIEVGII